MQKNASFARMLQSMRLKKVEPRAQLASDELKTNGLNYFKIIKTKLNSCILYPDLFLQIYLHILFYLRQIQSSRHNSFLNFKK